MYLVAAIFLIFSGIAALTYQVTWVRLLGLSMGSTSASISTVLAAFFMGMALGSFMAERMTRNRIHSFRLYIALEIIIALSGLALLPILLNLPELLASSPALGQHLGYKFFTAMALLAIPTICMGATFPVMASILVRKENEVGLRISQLYSLNTFGAVLGALFAGFWFIPSVGLDGAIYIAVALNLFVATLAMLFNRRISLPPLETELSTPYNPTEKALLGTPEHRTLALIVLFVTGFASIATEVAWTKYLSIFTGTTIYGFAAILGIFLIGIAAGSWAIKNRLESIQHPARWLAYGLLLVGLLLILTRAGLNMVPAIYEGINHLGGPGWIKQWLKYFLVFILLFPATFVFGALFPINLKLYCGDLHGVRTRVGKAYAINTLAAIAGSITAGFWLIPQYGTNTLLNLMAGLVILTPVLFLFRSQALIRIKPLAASLLFLALLHWLIPNLDYQRLITSVGYKFDVDVLSGKAPNYLFLKEGKVSVISLVTYDERYAKVQANGLNESIIDMQNPNNALVVESLLAYMPYFLHPKPESAFVVGYGGGITTRALTHTNLASIRVVELEEAVIEASRVIENGPALALNDPRVNLQINDARNTLLVEDNQYDIIAAQASHPWLAGASNVFTQEFFQLVHSRLNDDGIYSQWVNLFRMDVTTLRSLLKAFYNVFPHGLTMANLEQGDFLMIGSKQALSLNYEQIAQRMQAPAIKPVLDRFLINKPRDLLWFFALSRDEAVAAAGDATANRDTNILSEVRLSKIIDNPVGDENPYLYLQSQFQFDLVGYLEPQQAKQQLWEAAEFYLYWNTPVTAEKIIIQLKKIDPDWGEALLHHYLAWQLNYEAATELYLSRNHWLDQAHIQQMQIYLEQEQTENAQKSLARIQETQVRQQAQAMLAYYTGANSKLQVIEQQTQWLALLASRENIKQARFDSAYYQDMLNHDVHTLRSLIEYSSANNQLAEFNQWTNALNNLYEQQAERYKSLADTALTQEQISWAQRLIQQLELINPKLDGLYFLKQRLHKQLAKNNQALAAKGI
ncbi:MAG: fused MFS/spermidine synthase [Gammaproteobacteria bacterium]|nr:fused MFS/spermidine synthase [Gammaproteobacteria bacterium]